MGLPRAKGHGIGEPVPRKEDVRFLTGRGRFSADVIPDNAAHAAFVRSPYAHARIRSIDASQALAAPGVLAVLTGADLVADGMQPIPHAPILEGPPDVEIRLSPGFKVLLMPHMPMPATTARYVGEAVAIVVAESERAALDAVALVAVDYEPLPAVIGAIEAAKPGAPQIWPERPGNIGLEGEAGDRAATDAAFARAAHVARLTTQVQRVAGSPMEPRTILGGYDATTGVYWLHAGSGGGVVKEQSQLAALLGVAADKCHVTCGDMGGNFGTRNTFAPESAILPWAARRVGCPIVWIGDRQETFLTDYQGRDIWFSAELALDTDGNFLAVRSDTVSDLGAYPASFTPLRKGMGIMSGTYRIPAVHVRGRGVFTTTMPTTPYRSAGRPEAIYVIERLVDIAADEMGLDPIALRRRNLIQPAEMPYTNAVGITYDNGEYARGMDAALRLADWSGFPERRAEAKARGKLRGIGFANYIEGAGGTPRERAEITIAASGKAELVLGTMNSGQGHETSFPQLLVEWLGLPFESITYIAHDTSRVLAGGGSHSGRSMRIASLAVGEACDAVIVRAKRIAAHVLETTPDRIAFAKGVLKSADGGREIGILDVARAAETLNSLPGDLRGPLAGVGDVLIKEGAFPTGSHVCEVEVDPETGEVEIVRWSGVDDIGLAVNPLILHGQTHGAVAQGAGQALLENCHYDRETGQLLTASYMDYALPRADTLPSIDCELLEVPASTHKFGIRPGGEGGTTPALGATINAVVDALSELGVRHVEMPATPERVWRAMKAARSR